MWISLREAFIGLTIGYLSRIFFLALSISGQIMSISMGLSGVQLFNPTIGERATALDQFQILIGSLIFLAILGHHLFLEALMQSFTLVPISTSGLSFELFKSFGEYLDIITAIGLKLAAPVMVSIMIMNIMMGIIGRAVPQINVLVTSMPVNILVGFIVLIVSIPVIMGQMQGIVELSHVSIFKLLKSY